MSTQTAPVRAEDVVVTHEVVDANRSVEKRLGRGAAFLVVGALTIVFVALKIRSGADSELTFGKAFGHSLELVVPGREVALALGVVILLIGAWQMARGFGRRTLPWAVFGTFLAFMAAFLCWVSVRGTATVDITGLLQSSIALAVPLILGALAGVLCERSGVINIAIEGQMLSGAWAGALIGSVVGSYFGLLAAAVAGALLGVLLAIFSIKYLVNQVVLGVVLNVLALGLTGFLYDAFMQPNATTLNQPKVFGEIDIPLLSQIPVLGPLLFQANIVVYLAYVLIIVIDVALFRTRWGLRTRAVGEHPKAADTVGIKVLAVRYRNVILGGAVAGLGGAYFTIGSVGAFSKNITSGNGFIALAALIFGRWSPIGAVGASLLFGFATALQTMLSITVPLIPSNFLAMLPYLATIFAVAGLVGKVRAPAADGEPYVK
ncbi:MAG TPA: ABC transporter permease [Marmoricola sp.]|nr:ABC transporter permease [Marmoricola sp.]